MLIQSYAHWLSLILMVKHVQTAPPNLLTLIQNNASQFNATMLSFLSTTKQATVVNNVQRINDIQTQPKNANPLLMSQTQMQCSFTLKKEITLRTIWTTKFMNFNLIML